MIVGMCFGSGSMRSVGDTPAGRGESPPVMAAQGPASSSRVIRSSSRIMLNKSAVVEKDTIIPDPNGPTSVASILEDQVQGTKRAGKQHVRPSTSFGLCVDLGHVAAAGSDVAAADDSTPIVNGSQGTQVLAKETTPLLTKSQGSCQVECPSDTRDDCHMAGSDDHKMVVDGLYSATEGNPNQTLSLPSLDGAGGGLQIWSDPPSKLSGDRAPTSSPAGRDAVCSQQAPVDGGPSLRSAATLAKAKKGGKGTASEKMMAGSSAMKIGGQGKVERSSVRKLKSSPVKMK